MANRNYTKESEIWQDAINKFIQCNNVSRDILYDRSSNDYDKWYGPMEQAAAEAVLSYRKNISLAKNQGL
jgi:hypothetical protein